jgi:hypothetical protein
MAAEWVTSLSGRPGVSTSAWILRPFIFLPASYPTASDAQSSDSWGDDFALCAPFSSRFKRLAVDHPRARAGLAAFAFSQQRTQRRSDRLPAPVPLEYAENGVDRRARRALIARSSAPRAPRPQKSDDRIHRRVHVRLARLSEYRGHPPGFADGLNGLRTAHS